MLRQVSGYRMLRNCRRMVIKSCGDWSNPASNSMRCFQRLPSWTIRCTCRAHRAADLSYQQIMKGAPVVALVLFLFTDFGSNSVIGQAKGPAPVFKRPLEQIQSQTNIPILLPSKSPSAIREKDIKLASGRVSDGDYFS
jgi:hypothetical protein